MNIVDKAVAADAAVLAAQCLGEWTIDELLLLLDDMEACNLEWYFRRGALRPGRRKLAVDARADSGGAGAANCQYSLRPSSWHQCVPALQQMCDSSGQSFECVGSCGAPAPARGRRPALPERPRVARQRPPLTAPAPARAGTCRARRPRSTCWSSTSPSGTTCGAAGRTSTPTSTGCAPRGLHVCLQTSLNRKPPGPYPACRWRPACGARRRCALAARPCGPRPRAEARARAPSLPRSSTPAPPSGSCRSSATATSTPPRRSAASRRPARTWRACAAPPAARRCRAGRPRRGCCRRSAWGAGGARRARRRPRWRRPRARRRRRSRAQRRHRRAGGAGLTYPIAGCPRCRVCLGVRLRAQSQQRARTAWPAERLQQRRRRVAGACCVLAGRATRVASVASSKPCHPCGKQ